MSLSEQEREDNAALLSAIESGYARVIHQLSRFQAGLPDLRVEPPQAQADGRQAIECSFAAPGLEGRKTFKVIVESSDGDVKAIAGAVAGGLYLVGEYSADFQNALLDSFRLMGLGYSELPEGMGVMLPEDVQAQAMQLADGDRDAYRTMIDLAIADHCGIYALIEAASEGE